MGLPVIVEVRNLCKSYGGARVVDDISFEVQAGEVFTVVGPNGAGKTTTLECIEGLRKPDSGFVSVLGMNPIEDRSRLKAHIGIQLQESALQPNLKVWEACDLFASFYETTVDWRALLERLGLAGKRDSGFSKLSGGQKQRLYIALALLNDPDVVFLDELTTGLDPQARRDIWDLVLDMKQRGKTVVLTTHFMEEAAHLSDRVAIVDSGKMIALDTPAGLTAGLDGGTRLTFVVATAPERFRPEMLMSVSGVTGVEPDGARVVVHGTGEHLAVEVVRVLMDAKVVFTDLRAEQSTLEDVFLAKTGKKLVPDEEVRRI